MKLPALRGVAVEGGQAGRVKLLQFVTVTSSTAVIVRVLPFPATGLVLDLVATDVVEALTVTVFVVVRAIVGIGAGYLVAQ